MENRCAIAGVIAAIPEKRVSPAGVPVIKFKLRHDSMRHEAGAVRRVGCEIGVVACGEGFDAVAGYQAGDLVRVVGFLQRSDFRSGLGMVVIHAERIEPLSKGQEPTP